MEGPGIRKEMLKNVQMRKTNCRTWIMARKLKNVENETQTQYDLEYGEKHLKTWKMRNTHCKNGIMVRKWKNMKNEKYTLSDMDCGWKLTKDENENLTW